MREREREREKRMEGAGKRGALCPLKHGYFHLPPLTCSAYITVNNKSTLELLL